MSTTDPAGRPAPVSTRSPLVPEAEGSRNRTEVSPGKPPNSVREATAASNNPKTPPLAILRRSNDSTHSAAFGSIRFPSRAMPAKFVHLAPDSEAHVVVSLLVDTWRLVPPCAILALNPPSAGPLAVATEAYSQKVSPLNLMLRQRLADVARKTNAWVFSCGERSNQGAQVAGHAKAYGAKLGYTESPYIAVVAAGRMREELINESYRDGKVHRYSAAASVKDEPADALKVDLDSSHTHFIVVDGPQEGAEGLRDRLEFYLSSQDVSGDGIQTPKLLVVIGGDAATLEWVRNGLDDKDPATQTAVPVLVIAKTGGAANDIWRYCSREIAGVANPDYEKPIKADGERDAAYVEACAKWLPEILLLGQQTGSNTTEQLTFFNFDPDPDAENDLALAIEDALLNDCPNISQEAMLAVAWGEPVILQRHLANDRDHLLEPENKPDDDVLEGGKEVPQRQDLLQIALQRQDVEVVRTLLNFDAEPSRIAMDELFMEKFDRYPVRETKGMWKPPPEIKMRQPGSKEGRRPSTPTLFGRRPSSAKVVPVSSEAGDAAHAASPNMLVRSKTIDRIGRLGSGWVHAQQVLCALVDGYEKHLKVRKDLAVLAGAGDGRIVPTFTDLMMWAVLAGQHRLAELLWSKTKAPLRAALMASQLCKRLADNPALRADSDELGEQSLAYEDLAIEVLDAVRESDDAVPLVTLLPWEWGKDSEGKGIRELLWDQSALDSASEEDGLLSLPCMRFVAHRHCQHTLDKYFSGDFPGSRARIPPASGPLAIAAQALLPFAPGTIVEVMPVDLRVKPNVALRGLAVEDEYHETVDEEMDPDLIDAVDAIKRAASMLQAEKDLVDENTWRDLFEDLTSMRWLQYYDVPQVKFVLNFFVYLGYMLYAAFTLVHYDVTKGAISRQEIFLWVWAISREVGEFFELDEWSLAGLRMYIRDVWNQLDTLTFLLIMGAAAVRINNCGFEMGGDGDGGGGGGGGSGGCGDHGEDWQGTVIDYLPRSVYAIGVLVIFLRLLQFLKYQEHVGLLLIVLGGMKNDVLYFMVIMGVLSTGFGISFAVLLPEAMHDPWYQIFGENVLWAPYWGLMEGTGSFAASLEQNGGQEPTQTLAPVLLWVYIFASTVILINLLIAQMADTYSRVTADGRIRWQFERAALISEYKDTKPPLPPPLNVLCLAYYGVSSAVARCCAKTEEVHTEGFKTAPDNMDLRIYERREQTALKECLRQRSKRQDASVGGKLERLEATLAKLEEQSRTRSERQPVK